MDTIAVAEVARGDVLLVTQHPHDALAELILKLDRSPGNFSHAGIALGGGRILSAFPALESVRPLDLGGLRDDGFDYFFAQQDIYRLPVDAATHETVLAGLGPYLPRPGSFSVPKIVMVAASLHAIDPANGVGPTGTDRILRSALAAARATEDDGDFYCAEFVARLTGWPFTLADLVPPEPVETLLPMGPAHVPPAAALELLGGGHTPQQKALVHAFVEEVLEWDPEFFDEGLRATLREALDLAHQSLGRRSVADVRRSLVADESLPMSEPLPSSLVTPRMLRMRGEPERVLPPTEG